MEVQLIRNATLRMTYSGRTILVDPCLGAKGSFRTFAGIAPNPTIDLPMAVTEVLDGVDLTILSHLHPDHFDDVAASMLSTSMPILCQPSDLQAITAHGFTDVRPLIRETSLGEISITPTAGQHGSGEVLVRMGSVIGFILRAPDEPTVYWAGDTILTPEILDTVNQVKPEVIITHSGGAAVGGALLVMDDQQTVELSRHNENATLIAVHMEALDHCNVTRTQLRETALAAGIPVGRLRIPADGERIPLERI